MADADADADADSDSGGSGRRHRVLTTLFPPMVGPAPGPPPSLGGPPPLRLSSFISVWGASEEDERFTIFNDARSARCPLRDALCAMRGEEWYLFSFNYLPNRHLTLEYILYTVCAWHTKTETLPRVTYVISPIKLI